MRRSSVSTRVLMAVILWVLCPMLFAQQPASRVVVRAGRLLDVRSGKTLANQAIVIESGKIVSVGPLAEVKSLASDQIIELPETSVSFRQEDPQNLPGEAVVDHHL